MTLYEKYRKADELLKGANESTYCEYYAKYNNLLDEIQNSDDTEAKEFLTFFTNYLESLLAYQYMLDHGYKFSTKGGSRWQKK